MQNVCRCMQCPHHLIYYQTFLKLSVNLNLHTSRLPTPEVWHKIGLYKNASRPLKWPPLDVSIWGVDLLEKWPWKVYWQSGWKWSSGVSPFKDHTHRKNMAPDRKWHHAPFPFPWIDWQTGVKHDLPRTLFVDGTQKRQGHNDDNEWLPHYLIRSRSHCNSKFESKKVLTGRNNSK